MNEIERRRPGDRDDPAGWDRARDHSDVRFSSRADISGAADRVPCVDGSGLAREIFTSQAWSVLPCVWPVDAVHMTAGHNALRADQVPVKSSHSTMRWHEWVVLIAGSTGSALRAVRPPNLHITPDVRRNLVYAASATGCL